MIYNNIIDLIGNTPLLRLKYNKNIILKLESFNPFGSIKDRIAINMLNDAKRNNLINKNSIIIEASSGNTGIALAAACSALSYKLVITMPENASEERKRLIRVYGATLILTPEKDGMKGAVSEAERISRNNPEYYYINQFNNISNSDAHLETAEEIWRDTKGNIDFLVAGVGTGGTITGIAKYLKTRNTECKIIGVFPEQPNTIPGIGAGIELPILQKELIDEFIYVGSSAAINTCKLLAKEEGILVGPSSGAAIYAANIVTTRKGNGEKNVVVICPDSGERYLSISY